MISLHLQSLPLPRTVSEQPLQLHLRLLPALEVLPQETVAVGTPVCLEQVLSRPHLDLPVPEDEVVAVVGVGAVEAVRVDEGFLAEVAEEGAGVFSGDGVGLGVEGQLGEGAYELGVLKLGQEEQVGQVVDALVEVCIVHLWEIVDPVAGGEAEAHLLEAVVESGQQLRGIEHVFRGVEGVLDVGGFLEDNGRSVVLVLPVLVPADQSSPELRHTIS